MAARKMRGLALHDALDYSALVVELRPDWFDGVAVRWHRRLELETVGLTLAEVDLVLAALGALRVGDREAVAILKRMLRRGRPTMVPRIGDGFGANCWQLASSSSAWVDGRTPGDDRSLAPY